MVKALILAAVGVILIGAAAMLTLFCIIAATLDSEDFKQEIDA